MLGVDAALGGQRQQCALGGIADQLAVADAAVVGQRRSLQQRIERRGDGSVAGRDRPRRGITLAGHREAPALEGQGARGHLVHRQRAGLVRADHRRAAQRLDGGELLDDRAVLRHAVHADRQRHRHHRGQAFGNGCHGQRDRGERDLHQRLAAQQPEHEDQADNDTRDQRQAPPEHVELHLQRRGSRLGLGQHARQPAHLGGHAGGGDEHLCTAARDHRVHVGHVHAFGQWRLGGDDACGILGHRVRFTRERSLVDLDAVDHEQPPVRRHTIAGLQQHHVAGHEFGRGDLLDACRAPDTRHRREHLLQGCQRRLGPVLLPEAQQGIEQHHDEDDHGVLEVADRAGQRRRADQHEDQQAAELVEEGEPLRARRLFRQTVGAMPLQPGGRLVRGQAEGGVHRLRRRGCGGVEVMPGWMLRLRRPIGVGTPCLLQSCHRDAPSPARPTASASLNCSSSQRSARSSPYTSASSAGVVPWPAAARFSASL